MIDLNSPEYNTKLLLNKENILKYTNEFSIFKYYVGEFAVNGIMRSPFRKDSKPSFGVFYSKKYNSLLYKDLATGTSGDCISLVTEYFTASKNRLDAMIQIVVDFQIEKHFVIPKAHKTTKSSSKIPVTVVNPESHYSYQQKELGIISRKYLKRDYKFWSIYGISPETLKKYNVVPIQHFVYGKSTFKADTYAYAFIEKKDGITTYKIYQPFSKDLKFFTNMDSSIHAGYMQLPDTGDILVITKSLKDVMSISENTSYHTVSALSETVTIKEQVMDEYKCRFNFVCVFFDNDPAGLKMGREYKELYDIPMIHVPNQIEDCTDFTDVVKYKGLTYAVGMLDDLIVRKRLLEETDDLPF